MRRSHQGAPASPSSAAARWAAQRKWPLCVAFGLVTARKESDFKDATSSAVDLTHLGVAPGAPRLWAGRASKRAVEARGAPRATNCSAIEKLKAKWQRVTALIFMKARCLQKVTRAAFAERAKRRRKLEEEAKELERQEEEEEQEEQVSKRKRPNQPRSTMTKRETPSSA